MIVIGLKTFFLNIFKSEVLPDNSFERSRTNHLLLVHSLIILDNSIRSCSSVTVEENLNKLYLF